MTSLPPAKDKPLFTPGPLTTSRSVKQAMLCDLGSRDSGFIGVIREVREKLVALCADPADYTAVLVQGSGTYGIEAVLSSVIPPNGRLLVLINGAYGQRMQKIAEIHRIPLQVLASPEDRYPDPAELDAALRADPAITHVATVHCETTTGILNPIDAYGAIVKQHGASYIVDAMSSFGAIPVDVAAIGADYLISSSNKCIEGVPGFSFVIARKAALLATRGWARSLTLDLLAQWEGLEKDGQFRFTPPTHAILAFRQALLELEEEGGISGRGARYQQHYEYCIAAMESMGFEPFVEASKRGCIITAFRYPAHTNFDFHRFYESLSDKGQIIYPGKLSHADCFRIGHIGRLSLPDFRALMAAIAETLAEMQVQMPAAVSRIG